MTVEHAIAPVLDVGWAGGGEPRDDTGALLPDAEVPALQRMSADDADAAAEALSAAYSEVTVRVDPASRNLRMELASCTLPNLTLGSLEISSSTVRSPCYPLIAVCLPVSGEILITSNQGSARVGDQSGVVVSPGSPVVVDYVTDDCRMQTLLFERAAVETELANVLAAPLTKPLQFDLPFSVSQTSPFSRALSLLRHELTDPAGMTALPAMAARLGRLIIAGLLVSQPNNHSAELIKPRAMPGSRAIRNALELIESRPAEIETVADIAAAVGLSVRALDDGFQRYVGTPPMTYLRQVRMTRAHEDLLGADADETTATAIARKWGFGHYGRFAADYQRRFGRKPSETLRAVRK
jgi:AraC-like DNA-binding protein